MAFEHYREEIEDKGGIIDFHNGEKDAEIVNVKDFKNPEKNQLYDLEELLNEQIEIGAPLFNEVAENDEIEFVIKNPDGSDAKNGRQDSLSDDSLESPTRNREPSAPSSQ